MTEQKKINVFCIGFFEEDILLLSTAFEHANIPTELFFNESEENFLATLTYTHSKPEAILLDMDQLKIRGIDTLTRIRENQVMDKVPIIMVSTTSYLEDIDMAYKCHANMFVPKFLLKADKDAAINSILTPGWRNELFGKERMLFVLQAANSFLKVKK